MILSILSTGRGNTPSANDDIFTDLDIHSGALQDLVIKVKCVEDSKDYDFYGSELTGGSLLDLCIHCIQGMGEIFINTVKVTIILPDTSETTLSFQEFKASIVAGIKKRGYPIDRTQYRTNAILGYYNKYVIKFVGSENDY